MPRDYELTIYPAILLFYSPKGAEEAVWSQILSLYSVLITCAISIFQTSLTRYHAAIAVVLTGSPLSFYLLLYSVMSFWYQKHRLNGVVGKDRLLPRMLIIIAAVIWISIFAYILSASHLSQFSQESCSNLVPVDKSFYVLPFVMFKSVSAVPVLFIPLLAILLLIPLSWIIGVILQRKTIWPPCEPWQPRFGRTW